MERKNIVNVAVIGAGNIAREHVKAFSNIPGVCVNGIFSRTRSKTELLAKDLSVPNVCGSIRELRERCRPDIVVSAVDVMSMPDIILDCLDHDWILFIEKPPSLYLDKALAIEKEAAAKGRDVRVAMNRAFYSVTRTVLQEIANIPGRRIVIVEDQQDPEMFLKTGRPREIADRLMYGNSIHLVDYFRMFARGVVVRTDVKRENGGSRPEMVEAHIEFDGGDLGLYRAFWNQPAPWAVTVHVPDARYEMRPLEEGKRQRRGQKPEPIDTDSLDKDFKPGFRRQAEEMIRLASTGTGDVPTLYDAIKTMKLIKRIYGI